MIICNFLEFTSLTFNYINKVVHQPDNYGSIVSAIIVAFILFFIKEFFRIPPKLSGVFYLKSTTTESSYNPYKNIIIYYTLIIYSDGSIIEGTSEKTAETAPIKGDWLYTGKFRSRGKVTGRIERRYLRPHKIHIHIEENGSLRSFSHYIYLKNNDPFKWKVWKKRESKLFSGSFFSSSADSKGSIICQDSKFTEHPSHSSPSRYLQ